MLKTQLSDLSFKFYFSLLATLIFVILTSLIISTDILSIFTASCGIIYAFFAGAKKLICFIFGIIYSICYIYIAYKTNLYGDVMLNLIYLPMNILGIIHWKNHQNENNFVNIRSLKFKNIIISFCIVLILTILYGIFLEKINTTFAYLNGFAVVAQIVAFYLQVKRYIQNYLLVTLANITNVLIWFLIFEYSKENIAQLLNMIIFLIIGLYYYFIWKKSYNESLYTC
ncbi:nicotinamide riboside transporter PnuC [Campylobacter sp. TTU_617]|uniref:nicotinamide riboside transporter PnuC n=1 Tax=Campylobacter sp. TTU_617 TaxID=2768148 RepID=UPI0019043A86|nr:nicotinamide riboside transporter PnuC [Campylobacter sp. TTU_617]MBK1972372.1 nicotinamide mononucleotide transporter [Campylobacter sp. TTU_617]